MKIEPVFPGFLKTRKTPVKPRVCKPWFARGLSGTDPPDLTFESASPFPPQGSIWHRFDVDSGKEPEGKNAKGKNF